MKTKQLAQEHKNILLKLSRSETLTKDDVAYGRMTALVQLGYVAGYDTTKRFSENNSCYITVLGMRYVEDNLRPKMFFKVRGYVLVECTQGKDLAWAKQLIRENRTGGKTLPIFTSGIGHGEATISKFLLESEL